MVANFNLGMRKAVREEGIKQELIRELAETEEASARAAVAVEAAKVEVEKLASGRAARKRGKDKGQSCNGKGTTKDALAVRGPGRAEKPGGKGAARTPSARARSKTSTGQLSQGKKKKGGRKNAGKVAQPVGYPTGLDDNFDEFIKTEGRELTKDEKEERERLRAKLMRERTIARARDQVKQQTAFVATA